MKYLIFLFQFILLSTYVFPQNTTWSLLINTSDDRSVIDITTDIEENIYFTGLNRHADSYHFKGDVFKLNSAGILIDSLFFENHDTSIIVSRILPDTSLNFILAITNFGITSQRDNCGFKLKRIDSGLNVMSSSKKFLFPENYNHIEIYEQYGINNNIFVFGNIFPNQTPRMFIYELNMNFDSLQANIYLDAGAILPMELKQLNNSNLWLIGELKPYYILVNSMLNLVSKEQGRIPHGMNGSYGVKWDTDTSFYLAADYFIDNPPSDHDIGFLHQKKPFDTTGFIFNNWGSLDTNDYPAFWGALDYQNKDSIFIGATKNVNLFNLNFSRTPSWYTLLQTDSTLNIRWEHFYGGDAYYNMTKLIATSDGGCIMAGTRFDFKAHPWVRERDIYILKVNAEGLITSTNGKPASIVHDAIVYPNPGSNLLRVRVAAQHTESMFKLYNMIGELVLQQSIHGKTAAFNTTFLPPGTYVYRITAKTGLDERGKWVKE